MIFRVLVWLAKPVPYGRAILSHTSPIPSPEREGLLPLTTSRLLTGDRYLSGLCSENSDRYLSPVRKGVGPKKILFGT